jgi:DNA-binding transcriptional ArsR family regulator
VTADHPAGAAGSAGAVFAALADPTRRDILDALAGHGTATATTLAADLPVSRQAIVKHLAVLDAAGLVAAHRTGREMRYAVRAEPLTATARWMTEVASAWDARLTAIKRLAEAPDRSGDPGQPGDSGRSGRSGRSGQSGNV